MSQDTDTSPAAAPSPDREEDALAALQAQGLGAEDLPAIQDLAQALQDISPDNLAMFGQDVEARVSALSIQLLDRVRSRDLDAAGEKVANVARLVHSLNPAATVSRSRVPVIGGLIDRLRGHSGVLVQTFADAGRQVEQVVQEVSQRQGAYDRKYKELGDLCQGLADESRALGQHQVAAARRLADLQSVQQVLVSQDDPDSRSRHAEIDAAAQALDARVSALTHMREVAGRMLALVSAVPASSGQVTDILGTLRNVVLPAWKGPLLMQVPSGSQPGVMEVPGEIDMAALQHAHAQLVQTMDALNHACQANMQQRQQMEADVTAMSQATSIPV